MEAFSGQVPRKFISPTPKMEIHKIAKFGLVVDFRNRALFSAYFLQSPNEPMIRISTLTVNKPPTYVGLTCVDIWLSTYLPPLVNVVFGRPLMCWTSPTQ